MSWRKKIGLLFIGLFLISTSSPPGNPKANSAETVGATIKICFCGNGIIEGGGYGCEEDCEGDDLGGQTCESLGYAGGTLACDSAPTTCTFDTSGCIPLPTVTFQGYGHPGNLVTFKDGATMIGTTNVNISGEFLKTFAGQATGYHSYSLRSQNMSTGRVTNLITFMANLTAGEERVYSDILFSPTIGTSQSSYTKNDDVKTAGATFPFSTVFIYYASPDPVVKQATSNSIGSWSHTLTDEDLDTGSHATYCYVQTGGGLTSEMSPIVSFSVVTACEGDYNSDSWVNLTDFSILLYYWGKHDATHDLSGDGYVDLTDFSIMMYHWGKCP
jgi:hypothetical protein